MASQSKVADRAPAPEAASSSREAPVSENNQNRAALNPARLGALCANLSPALSQALVKPSRFSGQYGEGSVESWLLAFEMHLGALGESAHQYENAFPARLEGRALAWACEKIAKKSEQWKNATREEIKKEFVDDMQPIDDEEDARAERSRLRQNGAAEGYIAKFAEIQLRIPSASEAEAKQRFIDGIREDAKAKVMIEHPLALKRAFRALLGAPLHDHRSSS